MSHDGRSLLAARGTTAWVWDTETWQSRSPPLVHPAPVISASLTDDGSHAVIACEKGEAHVWDCATGRQSGPVFKNGQYLSAVTISSSSRVAAAAHGYTVRLWDVATGQAIGPALELEEPVAALAIRGDDKVIYVATNQTVQAFSIPLGARIGPTLAPLRKRSTNRFGGITLSPDGSRLHTYEGADASVLWTLPKPVTLNAGEIVSATTAITGLQVGENNAIDIVDTATWRRLSKPAE